MKRRDDPFERRDSFWSEDFGASVSPTTATTMVEDLARRECFLRGRAAAAANLGTATSSFSDLETFSSGTPSSSQFPYSQKNFHISDGNLYSVLSPFQARKSSARPAFLRGQSCVTSTSITSTSNRSSHTTSNSSTFRQQEQHQQQQQHVANHRRSKLKFHHQDMPPPYGERSRRQPRASKSYHADSEGDAASTSSSSWWDSSSSFGRDPFSRLRSEEDFLLSKRLKSPHGERFKRSGDEECGEEEELDEDIRRRLFRDSDWDSEDISKCFRRHRHQRRTARSSSSSVASASRAEEDDDAPLNLCLADYRRKLQSRIKSDFESDGETTAHALDEAESDAEGYPFGQWPRERKFGISELFDGFPAARSKFASGAGGERSKSAFEDEPRVLDLSMKEHSAKSASFLPSALSELGYADSFFVQNCQVPPPPPEVDAKSKRFAPISEMLENMRLQDADDLRHNALKRYLSARERLMHTHPEMFSGWERERCDEAAAAQTQKPFDDKPAFVPKDFLEVGPKAPDRPRSWDVTPSTAARASVISPVNAEAATPSRPESAEPCLESGPFVPGAKANFSVEKPPPMPEPKLMADGTAGMCDAVRGAPPPGPTLCSSCPEVPSLGSVVGSAKYKHHPKMKIKSESAIGGTQRTKARSTRKSGGMTDGQSSQYTNQDISICKFKLTKGVHPVLEEKKSFFVPMPRPPSGQQQQQQQQLPSKFDEGASCSSAMPNHHSSGANSVPFAGYHQPSAPSVVDKFRTFKIHVGSQEEMGRKLACGKRLRRRSQKALVREKLEATFREQGFLIKTQQVSSAEGAVYCKFRQLKKFTRYLYKSWKDHLPKELDDISKTQPAKES